ncbi:MAG: dephospho-CoA kinase [Acidobacteria bacterium]|nr:dephospho-CoA kinase [Acidobacteriota bacterium]
MLRVALTGGIGTGKSYCLARFAELGVPVVDADLLAREAVAAGSPGLAEVVARFGPDMLLPDGTLDRQALGRVVFADAGARAQLEAIIHPEVYRRIRVWAATVPPGTPVAMADVPLLFETGHQHDFDRVVVCACAPSVQISRVIARDGLSEADARARRDAQWPIEEKAARADYVIRTDTTFADTGAQVRTILERLKVEG